MPFSVSVTLPFDQIHQPDAYLSMEAVREIAKAADDAGFHAGAVTDHPVPSYRWLDNGGHYAQDPFVMLSLIAAVTTRLRLLTGILVLPYRNPFITARSVATLDLFSGGRVMLGVGAGYMKAEYKALGVDFDTRNDLTDEYLLAMKAAWTGEDFTFEGTGYSAVGNRMRPAPVQKPYPQLLVGGNSKRAIRRAVELGDAWHPVFMDPIVTQTSRTAAMAGNEDMAAGIAYLRAHSEKIGREVPPDIICSGISHIAGDWEPQPVLDRIGELRALGLVGCAVNIVADSRSEWCDLAAEIGERVLAKIDA
ncbi:MAG TPA: LLM class F420-dependent oxidoreductase [Sphingobium sp.]